MMLVKLNSSNLCMLVYKIALQKKTKLPLYKKKLVMILRIFYKMIEFCCFY